MAVMLKNGFKDNGLRTTFYCFLNDNPKPEEEVFKILKRRIIDKPEYTGAINKIIFYNNLTNQPIYTLTKC